MLKVLANNHCKSTMRFNTIFIYCENKHLVELQEQMEEEKSVYLCSKMRLLGRLSRYISYHQHLLELRLLIPRLRLLFIKVSVS